MTIGTHITHCCVVHGCKYGDDDCPVANGKMQQTYPCESCNHKTPSMYQHRRYRKKIKSVYYFKPDCKVWVKWHTVNGSGKVVGCASIEQPIIGSMYIIKMDNPQEAGIDTKVYPFDTLVIPEVGLTKIQ